MALTGRKPNVKKVPGVNGNDPEEVAHRTHDLTPPTEFEHAGEQALWDEYVQPAWWLRDHDAPKAHMWCVLQHQFFVDGASMGPGVMNQVRMLGSELGFDPGSRRRLAGPEKPAEKASSEFFRVA